jgi:hypothetical protein
MGFGGSGIAFQPESFEETDYTASLAAQQDHA